MKIEMNNLNQKIFQKVQYYNYCKFKIMIKLSTKNLHINSNFFKNIR